MSKKSSETVKVMVRVRPMNSKEIDNGSYGCTEVDSKANSICIYDGVPGKGKIPHSFTFDSVYDADSQQQNVYDESAFPLVESVLKGYNGTIFAYGQTGCGKSHTMMGVPDDPVLRGIIPNSFAHIFGCIDQNETDKKYLVRCSYLEIYNEDVFDLLTAQSKNIKPQKLELKESKDKGVFVQGLKQLIVKTVPEMEQAMLFGTNNRKTASTQMNATSSRSHSIFTIYIESSEKIEKGQRIKAGKLNLVDLAGSERSSKTGATGDTLKEGIKINLSLTALGNVISALAGGTGGHIPYRDSKLTRLLQDSLGGNTKTVMIAACSPANYNYEETLGTLKYANRAKQIKNKPKINEDPKDAMLKKYEDEIKDLKMLLEQFQKGGGKMPDMKGTLDNISSIGQENSVVAHSPGGPGKSKSKKADDMSVEELVKALEKKGIKQVLPNGQSGHASKVPSSQATPVAQSPKGSPGKEVHHATGAFGGTFSNPKDDGARQLNGFDHGPVPVSNQGGDQQSTGGGQQSDDNQALQEELRIKDQQLGFQSDQQSQLESLIRQLENQAIGKGNPTGLDTDQKQAFQLQRKEQLKLKKKRKAEQHELQRRIKEEEALLLGEAQMQIQNDQEELETLRLMVGKLRKKYQQGQMEIQDLKKEHGSVQAELLEIIRFQEKDVKFSDKIVQIMLKENELYKLREKANWDENLKEWKIPLFIFNAKQGDIAFPTIGAKGRVEQSKEERELAFPEDGNPENSKKSTGGKGKKTKKTYLNEGSANGSDVVTREYSDQQVEDRSPARKFNNFGSGNESPVFNGSEEASQSDMNLIQQSDRRDRHANQKSMVVEAPQGAGSLELPERRRKYLKGEQPGKNLPLQSHNASHLGDEISLDHLKTQKKRVASHLEPLKPHSTRNASVPQLRGISETPTDLQHPINNAPAPVGRGGANKQLGSINHAGHKIKPLNLNTSQLAPMQNAASAAEASRNTSRFRTLEPLSK